jgi:hypothetical protein
MDAVSRLYLTGLGQAGSPGRLVQHHGKRSRDGSIPSLPTMPIRAEGSPVPISHMGRISNVGKQGPQGCRDARAGSDGL